MSKDLEVLSSVIVATGSGQRISCEMSDGSTWSCNSKGEDWKLEKPSHKALAEMFNKQQANEKSEKEARAEKGSAEEAK